MSKFNPVSTYRLQFNKNFKLKDAERILPYVKKLGIKTVYASPLFTAVKGSLHGYDVTNPLELNPEIGSEEDLRAFIKKLRDLDLGVLLDIVPNHMAFSTENPLIYDVLEKGESSGFYSFFDILKNHPDKALRNKLMLPFFGKPLEQLLTDKELSVGVDKKGFTLNYFDSRFPVSVPGYPFILEAAPQRIVPPPVSACLIAVDQNNDFDETKHNLINDYFMTDETEKYVNKCLSVINSDPEKLGGLVNKFFYRPAFWKDTEHLINYRRFFTINGLICVNIQDEEVFDVIHKLTESWLKNNLIQGIRADHIDGLFNPAQYLDRLRELAGNDKYLIVEKILEKDEKIPENWPVEGTTGYDFLGLVNKLLTNSENGKKFYSFYKAWIDKSDDFSDVFYGKSRFILYNRLEGELDNLTRECSKIKAFSALDFESQEVKKAIGEFLIFCPVYKIYNSPSTFSEQDKKLVSSIFSDIKNNQKVSEDLTNKLEELFLLRLPGSERETSAIDTFFRHCMQFTGPLMAKGIEDTAFYSYNPFICHNEVGDSPAYFGISADAFHKSMRERMEKQPLTMNAISTHDTKRGEDTRARLNVLSDIPDKWMEVAQKWREVNRHAKKFDKEKEIPTPNDEYFIYQVLCAHLPMNAKIEGKFISRLEEYLVKAMRESKDNSSWSDPDEYYENGTLAFVRKILSPDSTFPEVFLSFMEELIPHGLINSITQLILKNAVPGIPDTFQGTENWNLSFVDPDNRRLVNYKKLSKELDQIIKNYQSEPNVLAEELWVNASNGLIKQWISWLTLNERIKNENLFLKGSYTPLKVSGELKEHIISFSRQLGDDHLIVVLPTSTAALPENFSWSNTRVKLPELSPVKWVDLLTGKTYDTKAYLNLKDLFKTLPFAILKGEENVPKKRAGILMHVTSLPGEYGIGDAGMSSRKFVDFLKASGQGFWQTLPLNITNLDSGHSPYSSFSAFAGNTLLIDPQQLASEGLLLDEEVKKMKVENGDQVNYLAAQRARENLLDKAYDRFMNAGETDLKSGFKRYKEREKEWLADFAIFVVLKEEFDNLPWNEWPPSYRNRDEEHLKKIALQHETAIERIIFKQFIFDEQWKGIKGYANENGISIIGDIPIYVSYDSADVWSHPHLFKLQEDKSMAAVAGVPPDYFNENGQLWGMPLFDWEAHKKEKYRWWIHRIGRNLHWFNQIRLDHFRGFSAYWEVPGNEETAMNGEWVEGPGTHFFDTVKHYFPDMPFIAEDLGHIDQAVYDLRDHYKLPGMSVVQFGFGDNMPFLQHNPLNHSYNSIVYTGTHDNNTMLGWFRQEADKQTLKRFKQFAGHKLTERNCHTQMIRVAYASAGKLTIVPMQDWLGLGEKSRMNFPSTTKGNWLWKLVSFDKLDKDLTDRMREMVKTFGRY